MSSSEPGVAKPAITHPTIFTNHETSLQTGRTRIADHLKLSQFQFAAGKAVTDQPARTMSQGIATIHATSRANRANPKRILAGVLAPALWRITNKVPFWGRAGPRELRSAIYLPTAWQ